MRFRKTKRCRSAMWWGFFACALLLIGAYVIFDILDVDGSQMNRWPSHDMMVVDRLEVVTEHFFRADHATLCSADLIVPSPSRLSSTETSRISAATTLLRIRQSRMLPRLNLAQEQGSGSSPTVDPVVTHQL